MKVYKIFDREDENYNVWYGDVLDVERYLEEQKEQIPDYDEELSWTDNLHSYGLDYEVIYDKGEDING